MVVDNLPAVDLSGLSGERFKEAKQLLYDGHESFAQDDDQRGSVSELQMIYL